MGDLSMVAQYRYYLGPAVHYGPGVANNVGKLAVEYGAKKVFYIYDKNLGEMPKRLEKLLKDEGLEVAEFTDVVPNPPEEMIERAAEIAKEAKCNLILAVGGGSTIDTAKGVKVLMTNPAPLYQYRYGGESPITNPTPPLFAIPTTAGTGSEVTSMTIVTSPKNSRKYAVGGKYVTCDVAIADPELLKPLPASVTASTGMDALTHAIEAYTNTVNQPITDMFALKAMELIGKSLFKATWQGDDVEARFDVLMASLYAGTAFDNAFVALAHSIAHPLSARCGLGHGAANAAVLPYVTEYNAPACEDRTIDVGVALGLHLEGLDKKEAVQKVIDHLFYMNKVLGIKTLGEQGAKKSTFKDIVNDVMTYEPPTGVNARKVKAEDVMEILEKAY
jgi:alcohol dehydrogenase